MTETGSGSARAPGLLVFAVTLGFAAVGCESSDHLVGTLGDAGCAETDQVFCQRLGFACGEASATDSCGKPRTAFCGDCPQGWNCQEHACICTPEPEEAVCARLGRQCGVGSGRDNCDSLRHVDCGACPEGSECVEATGQCICIPETQEQFCQRLGKDCGLVTAPDNCGTEKSFICGTCKAHEQCEDNVCVCRPQTDAELCEDQGRNCGPTTAVDRCLNPREVASCGECGGKQICEPMTGTCQDCEPESDALFCERQGKNCGTLSGVDNCGSYREEAECGSCPEGEICGYDQRCSGSEPPANDTCDSPALLTLDETGFALGYGDLTKAASDGAQTCADAGARDAVFKLVLPETSDLDVRVITGWKNRILSIRDECILPESERACSRRLFPLDGALTVKRLPAGEYYLWVGTGADASDVGPFQLEVVARRPPAPAANDTCAAPLALSFNGDTAHAQGDTARASDDLRGPCDTSFGNDLVYAVTLDEPSMLEVTVTRDPAFSKLQPWVYIQSECGSPLEEHQVACGRYLAGRALALAPSLPIGTYYVVVDSLAGSFGTFDLTIRRGEPIVVPNDTCETALPILLDATGFASVSGDTRGAFNDTTGACGAMTGPDRVWKLELAAPSAVLARLSRDNATPLYQPAIHVSSTCPPQDEVMCARYATSNPVAMATSAAHPNGALPAGTYYVFVDGLDGTDGRFVLDLIVSPPVLNDTCEGAEPLVFVDDLARARGNTAAGTDNGGGKCSYASNKDLVYTFTPPTTKRLTLRVTPEPGTPYRPAISVRTDCATPDSELRNGCVAAPAEGAPVELALPRVDPVPYYVWIEGSGPGPFVLEALYSEFVPAANDTCDSPEVLAFGAEPSIEIRSGETALGENDYVSVCSSTLLNGPDLVYQINLAVDSSLDVTVSRDPATPAWRPSFALRRTCADDSKENHLACVAGLAGDNSKSTTLSYVPAGTYYLIVDGAGTQAVPGAPGAFELKVDAAPLVPGESCVNPVRLSFDAEGKAQVQADSTNAFNDSLGCSGGSGMDLTFEFTLDQPRRTEIVVQATDSAFCPTLSLRGEFCENAGPGNGFGLYNASCRVPSTTPDRRLLYPHLPQGTYWIWVDGYTTTAGCAPGGKFSVTVLTSPPAERKQNDDCGRPELLVFNKGPGVAEITGDNQEAFNDFSGAPSTDCGGDTGGDLTYLLTLENDATVTAQVKGSGNMRPVVYIRPASACASSAPQDQLACAVSVYGSYDLAAASALLPRGDYVIIVDSPLTTTSGHTVPTIDYSGPFTLTVTVMEPLYHDTCDGPKELSFTGNTLEIEDDSTFAEVHTGGSCASTTYPFSMVSSYVGKDLFYTFRLDEDAKVSVELQPLSPSGGTATLKPVVFLRAVCDDPFRELGCASSTSAANPAAFTIDRLRRGTYFAVVQGYSGSFGPFRLRITQEQPVEAPANDSCATAKALAWGLSISERGTTAGAANDSQGTCIRGNSVHSGGDVVYSLTPPLDSSFSVTASAETGSSLEPVLYVRTDCNSEVPAHEISCANHGSPSPSGTAAVTVPLVRANETIYIVVDSASPTKVGSFYLTVERGEPVVNDRCEGAITIDLRTPASVSGDTRNALNDTLATCSSCGSYGNDVVYHLALGSPAKVTAKVTPTGSVPLKAVVSVRRACDQRSTEIASAGQSSNPVELVLPFLPEGDYWLWVDGYGSSATSPGNGQFILEVSATSPDAPVQPNDTCEGAIALQFDAQGVAPRQTFDTTYARHDHFGSCAEDTRGPDVVYTFTLTEARKLVAKLTQDPSTSTYRPVLYLRQSCTDSDVQGEIACRREINDAVELTVNRLEIGTYYLVVDGESTASNVITSGKGTLDVSALPPEPAGPANDHCATAETLAVSSSVLTISGSTVNGRHDAYGTCFSTSHSPDVVYRLVLSEPSTLSVTMTGLVGVSPVIYLRDVCGSRAQNREIFCVGNSTIGSSVSATSPALLPGSYYLWADATGSTTDFRSGTFTLEISASPAAIANDVCETAIALMPGVTVTGSTRDMAGNYGANRFPNQCDLNRVFNSAEAVYTYTPVADGPFQVLVVPTSVYGTALWATKGTCGEETSCIAVGDLSTNDGVPERLRIDGKAGETYYIFVDGSGTLDTKRGEFWIRVD